MEARGKYDFSAASENELSFKKGDILKIINHEDDWCKAEMNGQEGFITKNYIELQIPDWFKEDASRSHAEDLLRDKTVGEFVIRGRQSSPGDFSISVKHENDVQHFKVMRDNEGQYFLWLEKFPSLNKLVDFYKTNSISKTRQIFLYDGSSGDWDVLQVSDQSNSSSGSGYQHPSTSVSDISHDCGSDEVAEMPSPLQQRTSLGNGSDQCVSSFQPRDQQASISISDICHYSVIEEEEEMLCPLKQPINEEKEMSLSSILEEFKKKHINHHKTLVVVAGGTKILHSAISALRNDYLDWPKRPQVEFAGEKAEDSSGLTRKFMRLLMKEVQGMGVFEGPENNLLFTYNQAAFDQNRFYTAGKLAAWSIVHGGPGLRCLNPILYKVMCGRVPHYRAFDYAVLCDTDVQHNLQRILQCDSDSSWSRLKEELGGWIARCGAPYIYSLPMADRLRVVDHLIRHFVFLRPRCMIEQFIEGFNSCGFLWETVKKSWRVFQKLFTKGKPLSREEFKALYYVKWSNVDSAKRAEEEETMFLFESNLVTIAEGEAPISFEDILAFWTGADEIPLLGFARPLQVDFFDTQCGECSYPYASTSSLTLSLPTCVIDEDSMMALLAEAIRRSIEFGNM